MRLQGTLMELHLVQDLFFKEETSQECSILFISNNLFFNQYVFDFSKLCF
jgi:hypothetical protein